MRFFHKLGWLLKRYTVPVLIGGILTLLLYIPFFGNGPSNDPDAVHEVDRFRKWYAFRRGQGVWYDTADFKAFIDTFSTLVKYAENPNHPPHNGPEDNWVIGFYWKRKKDNDQDGKVKYSFCMVPTLVKNGVVIDYFEDRDKAPELQEYNHKNDLKDDRETIIRFDEDTLSNAFDNGQLWP